MSHYAVRAPRCPGCDSLPKFCVDTQAFCGDQGCQVLSWNMMDDPAQFKAKAVKVDLNGIDALLPPEVTVAAWTCPDCGKTSHHPRDIEHQYCGNCHTYSENRS